MHLHTRMERERDVGGRTGGGGVVAGWMTGGELPGRWVGHEWEAMLNEWRADWSHKLGLDTAVVFYITSDTFSHCIQLLELHSVAMEH